MMLSNAATKIAQEAYHNGGTAFVVGGAVRDFLMGKPPKDTDILIEGLYLDDVEFVLSKLTPGVKSVDLVGKAFGVFKVKFHEGSVYNGETLDVAVPRTERSTGTGHRDFEVSISSTLTVEDDLSRRDFTMNAIAFDILSHEIVDPFGGQEDIRGGNIRAVGNPVERFEEDPLRILRAFRFAARYGFVIERDTRAAIKKCAHLLNTVSNDRVGEEFAKVVSGDFAPATMRNMSEWGILSVIIPEWTDSIGFEQNNPHHYATVDGHVLDAFEATCSVTKSVRARIAVLLHDIAKPATYRVREK